MPVTRIGIAFEEPTCHLNLKKGDIIVLVDSNLLRKSMYQTNKFQDLELSKIYGLKLTTISAGRNKCYQKDILN